MPSIEIAISAWWAVALAAQVAWLFLVVRPVWARFDRPSEHRFRWVAVLAGGPLLWALAAWDEIDQWKIQRHNRKMREARGE